MKNSSLIRKESVNLNVMKTPLKESTINASKNVTTIVLNVKHKIQFALTIRSLTNAKEARKILSIKIMFLNGVIINMLNATCHKTIPIILFASLRHQRMEAS